MFGAIAAMVSKEEGAGVSDTTPARSQTPIKEAAKGLDAGNGRVSTTPPTMWRKSSARPRARTAREDKNLLQFAESHYAASSSAFTQHLQCKHAEVYTRQSRVEKKKPKNSCLNKKPWFKSWFKPIPSILRTIYLHRLFIVDRGE